MIRKVFITLSMLMVVILAGCDTKHKQDTITEDSAVSEKGVVVLPEPAVGISAQFTNSDSSVKKNRYENDYIRIFYDEDYEGMQENLDGTGRVPANLGEDAIDSTSIWLTNDWLYSVVYNESDDTDMICRTSVNENAEPMYDNNDKEVLMKLKEEQEVVDLMVMVPYVFYSYHDDNEGTTTFCCYHLENKTYFLAFTLEGNYFVVYNKTDGVLPVVIDNHFYLMGDGKDDPDEETDDTTGGLYRVSFDTWEVEKVDEFMTQTGLYRQSLITEQGGNLYWLSVGGTNVEKYDGKESVAAFAENTYMKVLNKLKLWPYVDDPEACNDDTDIYGVYVVNDRLYILVNVRWSTFDLKVISEKDKGKKVDLPHDRTIPYYVELKDNKKCKTEDALSEFLCSHSEPNAYCEDRDDDGNDIMYKTNFTDKTLDTQSDVEFIYGQKIYFYTFEYPDNLLEDELYLPNDDLEVDIPVFYNYYSYDLDTHKVEEIDETTYSKFVFYAGYTTRS